ncbi:MAG: hypothetical protein ACE5OQ_15325 [Woeseia sp.]
MFSVYHHYILVSPGNIAKLPAGLPGMQRQFIDSAAAPAIVELMSALLGFFLFGRATAARQSNMQ